MNYSTWIWIGSLVTFYGVTVFMEKRAAMRGTHRAPMSPAVDKGLRLFFLFLLTFPAMSLFPKVCIPIVLVYLPTFIDGGEKTGKRMSKRFKQMFIWRFFARYFQLEVVATGGKLDPKKSYIIALHPHGFLPFGTMVNVLTNVSNVDEKFLNGVPLRSLAASFCFYIPIYRDIILAGGIMDAARYNARQALHLGNSIALVPGGASEGLYAHPGTHKLILKKRLGFIKLAMEEGVDVVPAYSFGETDCYSQLSSKLGPGVKAFQSKFQRIFGLSLPLVTNIIPRRTKITTVFGKPMKIKHNKKPTDEEVRAVLDEYIERITQLFNENAATYIANPEHRKLEII